MPIKKPEEGDEQAYDENAVANLMVDRRLKALERSQKAQITGGGTHGMSPECQALCAELAGTFRSTPFTLGMVCDRTQYDRKEAAVLMEEIVECGCIDMPTDGTLGRTLYRCSAQTCRENAAI